MNLNKQFFLLFFLFIGISSFSQTKRLKITHLTPDDGLSHIRAWRIVQDKMGFIWFATDYGLNKYDGYKFTVYKNNEKDTNSLAESFLWDMVVDKEGNLWLGTNGGGLDKFDVKTEIFYHHKNMKGNKNSLSNNEVRSLFIDQENKIWMGVGISGGIVDILDSQTGIFTHLSLPVQSSGQIQSRVCSFAESKNGIVWMGLSAGGLFRYDKKNKTFKHFEFQANNPNSVSGGRIINLYYDKDGKFWVGTSNSICLYDEKTEQFTRFDSNSLDKSRFYDSFIEDDHDNLWLSSTNGLCIFNKHTQQFTNLFNDPNNPNTIMGNSLAPIFMDNSGIIWVNVLSKGIDKIDRNAYKFRHYYHDPQNPNSISGNLIRALLFDKDNNLWLGLMTNGLDKLVKHKKLEHFSGGPPNTNTLSEDPIVALLQDSKNNLWAGNQNFGLNVLQFPIKGNSKNGITIQHFRADDKNSNKYQFASVKAILEDKAGTIWIGSELGIDKYDSKNNAFIHYMRTNEQGKDLSDFRIQFFYMDSKGYIWIGTWEGLNRMLPSSFEARKMTYEQRMSRHEQFISFKKVASDTMSISSDKVISMNEDKNGNFWFGTYGGGMNRLVKLPDDEKNVSEYKFKHYNEFNGLPNNVVYGIQGDDKGQIWISTNDGLARLDPATDKIRVYRKKDGLQGDQFFWGASGKSNDGELIFGGVNGYNAFYPDEIKDNSYKPPIVFTSFKINNELVNISSQGKVTPLISGINLCRKIELSYLENSFSFEFSALHFTSPEDNQYAYILEGFDKNWITTDSKRRFANYTNIDPGVYTFKVRGSNCDGVWNETGTSIEIRIRPPFWKTWWFVSSVVFIIVSFAYFSYKMRIHQMQQRNLELEKMVEERTKEINQQKEELQQSNVILQTQKEEISAQAELLQETNEALNREKEYTMGSIRYAKTIQNAILPEKSIINKFFESFIIYKPKDIVSGDFYWFSWIKNSDHPDQLMMAVVDCTGHGVPGAFMSMIGSRLFNEIVNELKITDPAEILAMLDKEIQIALHQLDCDNDDGMDVCLCLMENGNNDDYQITFSGAKRPLLYLSKDEGLIKKISGAHRSIGGVKYNKEKVAFENHFIKLSKDSVLYLSTDGFIDQNSPDRKRFGTGHLIDLLQKINHLSMSDQKESLEYELSHYMRNERQRDDITMVGLKIIG